MFRKEIKTRLLADGGVEIVDPDLECLPLMQALNQDFSISQCSLPGYISPRFQAARRCTSSFQKESLILYSDADLWSEHILLLTNIENANANTFCNTDNASLLDIKIELSRRILATCKLCGRQCEVDRLSGQRGKCGLGSEAYVAEVYTHISEEPPINPSCNISLAGCGLGCRFCQKHELLDSGEFHQLLDMQVWNYIETQLEHVNSVSFIGGNPDESLYEILKFLASAPSLFNKPIVWNSNGFAMPIVYRLLEGVVDAYVPDAKFYALECGARLAGAPKYFEILESGLYEMVTQKVPMIVRILVLPGHIECCHKPMIDFLAQYSKKIILNIMGQYYPDYQIELDHGPEMIRRPYVNEVNQVREYANSIDNKWQTLDL